MGSLTVERTVRYDTNGVDKLQGAVLGCWASSSEQGEPQQDPAGE